MKKVNILYFSSFGSFKGGGQKSLLLLLNYLDKERFHPVCACPEKGTFTEKLEELGVRNHIVSMGATKSLNLLRIINTITLIYRILKHEDIDIVHTDGMRNTFYAGISAKLARIPVITHIRVVDRPRFNDKILALLTDYFIFVSKAAKKRFEWIDGKIPSAVIYNGISAIDFEKYIDNRELQEKNEYRIGCIGRVEKVKGQIYLIRAAKMVLKKFPECRFIIVGETDREYLEYLRKEAFPIVQNITFTGHVDNPYDIMRSLDIIVLPSLSEGFSRVILESMAMKKPVIATDAGGNPEAIIDGKTGFLTEVCRPDKISSKIIDLLENRIKRTEMGEKGYRRIKELFGIDENTKRVEKIYETALSLKDAD